MSGQLARFLELAKNVSRLKIQVIGKVDRHPVWQPILCETMPSLSTLKKLTVEGAGAHMPLDVRHMPRLQQLRLGWCNLNLEQPHDDNQDAEEAQNPHGQDPSWVHTGLEDLELIGCECNDTHTFMRDNFCRALKHFPSLQSLTIATVDTDDVDKEMYGPLTWAADICPLLEDIHIAYPSLKKLCISRIDPTILPKVDWPGELEDFPFKFPKFRHLSHLTFFAVYLNVDSKTNSLVTLCHSCPRLQSLVIVDVHSFLHDPEFCDTVFGFATELADARAQGREFGTHLKELTLEGKWGASFRIQNTGYEGRPRSPGEFAFDCLKWWELQHPFASLFASAGISYKEDFTLFDDPMKEVAKEWELERDGEELAANAVEPE